MRFCRPPLFRKRQVETVIIVTCVRWYCRFFVSLRDLKELMAERGLAVDHTTIWRWVQRYGAEVHRRLRGKLLATVKQLSTETIDVVCCGIAGMVPAAVVTACECSQLYAARSDTGDSSPLPRNSPRSARQPTPHPEGGCL